MPELFYHQTDFLNLIRFFCIDAFRADTLNKNSNSGRNRKVMKLKTLNQHLSALLKADEQGDGDIKEKILQLDYRVQQMLLWSNIAVILSYLLLIAVVARIYGSYSGKHSVLLICSLILIYVLLAIYLFVVWKSLAYQRIHFKRASKAYLNYQISKLGGQRKLISVYLLIYGLILCISCLFFFIDIHNGITLLFKLTAPVSLMTYIFGLYFIISFTDQKKKLDKLDKQIEYLSMMEKISRN